QDSDSKNELSLLYLAILVCTIEIVYYAMYCYGFMMNANFTLDLETAYFSYYLINDVYSGASPYLLIFLSSDIKQDVRRLISR
ncbi:hypothetical protein PFISCL1PPCAC_14127, partial [Pristionchus fissidentatus]